MHQIPTHLFKPQPGSMYAFLFANSYAGIKPTLFYSITIPLEPFDSGLEWEEQPVETEFRLEFLELQARDWCTLDGHSFTLSNEQSDSSIYLGGGHCPVDILLLRFSLIGKTSFHLYAEFLCHFEDEGVGENAKVCLETDLEYKGLVIDTTEGGVRIDRSNLQAIHEFLASFVELDAYGSEVQASHYYHPDPSGGFMLLRPRSE